MRFQPTSSLTEDILTIFIVAQMALPVERQEVPVERKLKMEEVLFGFVKMISLLYSGLGFFG